MQIKQNNLFVQKKKDILPPIYSQNTGKFDDNLPCKIQLRFRKFIRFILTYVTSRCKIYKKRNIYTQ